MNTNTNSKIFFFLLDNHKVHYLYIYHLKNIYFHQLMNHKDKESAMHNIFNISNEYMNFGELTSNSCVVKIFISLKKMVIGDESKMDIDVINKDFGGYKVSKKSSNETCTYVISNHLLFLKDLPIITQRFIRNDLDFTYYSLDLIIGKISRPIIKRLINERNLFNVIQLIYGGYIKTALHD